MAKSPSPGEVVADGIQRDDAVVGPSQRTDRLYFLSRTRSSAVALATVTP